VMTGTPLNNPFVFSFMRRGKGATTSAVAEGGKKEDDTVKTDVPGVVHPYENSIKTITEVATVEEFWRTYDFLKRPNDLPTTTDYHFFRSGIKPTWEDVRILDIPRKLVASNLNQQCFVLLCSVGSQCKRWEMDYSHAEGSCKPVLGGSYPRFDWSSVFWNT
jgi:Eukaryotic initiation factor 4E